MPHEVIMPALGMAQNTGTIVRWHKQAGDAVSVDDILMEVETDKATMEVEAGFDGIVSAVLAEVDTPVPVGAVIAIISGGNDRSTEQSVKQASVTEPAVVVENTPSGPAAPAPPPLPAVASPVPATMPVPSSQRILASPKARVLARQRGIDLGRLVAQGIAQPIHVADLERLKPEPVATTQNAVLCAQVAPASIESFRDLIAGQSETETTVTNLWAAFYLASFRAAGGLSADTAGAVEITRFETSQAATWMLENPDKAGFSRLQESRPDIQPQLRIFDFTSTPVSHYYHSSSGRIPALSVTRHASSGVFSLQLEFNPQQLAVEMAVEVLCDLVRRAEQPLRQLL
jgi:hypothetical protein